jgi:hypothetical protein
VVAVAGMNNSLVTDDLSGHGSGHKIKSMMGHMGFLTSTFYVHGHGFGLAKANGFAPIAISTMEPLHAILDESRLL